MKLIDIITGSARSTTGTARRSSAKATPPDVTPPDGAAELASPDPAPPAVAEVLSWQSTRQLADAVWAEMRWRKVLPTPRNFSLWFTYRADADPRLTKRMAELLEQGGSISAETLETLYDEHITSASDAEPAADSAAEIEDAARTLIEQIAGSEAAVNGYGTMLANVKVTLGGDCTQANLLRAVTTLAAETARAAERNGLLRDQLAGSVVRIARLRQSLTVVKQEATTDSLTGIANRKWFDQQLRRMIRQARTEPCLICVLLLDIDHFKAFNDTYGHRTGDLVLRLVARVLSDNVKGRDRAARYGGEEFGIVLTGTDLAAAVVVARQISASMNEIRLLGEGEQGLCGTITVSGGVALHRPGESMADLVERADQALYEAKRRGRNQVCAAPVAEAEASAAPA